MDSKPVRFRKTRAVVKFVVSFCVVFVIRNLIKNNTSVEKKRHQAQAFVGGVVVAEMVGDRSDELVDDIFDSALEIWDGLKEGWTEKKVKRQ